MESDHRVVVEPAGEHHLHGNLYQVHLRITLPGREIVVSREPRQHVAYKEVAVAVHDAFDSARRRLQDYTRRRRGAVKAHGLQPRADFGHLTVGAEVGPRSPAVQGG